MTIQTVADDLVSLWKAGQFAQAGEKYWADDVLSVEPMGDTPASAGKDAARDKGEWWTSSKIAEERFFYGG